MEQRRIFKHSYIQDIESEVKIHKKLLIFQHIHGTGYADVPDIKSSLYKKT